MSIVLFAILGASVKAGVGYWICFAFYAVARLTKIAVNFIVE